MAAPHPHQRSTDGSEAPPLNRRESDEQTPHREHVAVGMGPSRRRELFKRFRQPLIGLGLAGMALPMVQATTPQGEPAAPEPVDTAPADPAAAAAAATPAAPADPAAAAAAAADAEEKLVAKIAETTADSERTQMVDEAVKKYDIERGLAEDIYDIAQEKAIDPQLAFGLVRTESMFKERAVSHVGARGLTQVMPRTAAWLIPGTKTDDLYDRQTNLRLGFQYLDQLIHKYKGNVRLALLAYNRGPGTVDRVLRRGGNPDNGYADKVLRG